MSTWANPFVGRLAHGDAFCCQKHGTSECCGLVLNCAWPMPAAVVEQYADFSERLQRALPKEAYIYPSGALHVTIATLRPFTAGPLDDDARQAFARTWAVVLDRACDDDSWPISSSTSFRLRMGRPTMEGSAAIFHLEDTDGAIAAMRGALKRAIELSGGKAAEGGGDRGPTRAPEGLADDAPAAGPHLPNIVHSTVVRWAAEPADRDAVAAAFAEVAATWAPLEICVPSIQAVFEDVPYMHIPTDGSRIWWSSSTAGQPPRMGAGDGLLSSSVWGSQRAVEALRKGGSSSGLELGSLHGLCTRVVAHEPAEDVTAGWLNGPTNRWAFCADSDWLHFCMAPGRTQRDWLLSLGFEAAWLEAKVRTHDKRFSLLVFRPDTTMKSFAPTWANIFETALPLAFPGPEHAELRARVLGHRAALESTPFDQIEAAAVAEGVPHIRSGEGGHGHLTVEEYMHADDTLVNCRRLLRRELQLTPLFAGGGVTVNEDGTPGFRELMMLNVPVAKLPELAMLPLSTDELLLLR